MSCFVSGWISLSLSLSLVQIVSESDYFLLPILLDFGYFWLLVCLGEFSNLRFACYGLIPSPVFMTPMYIR